ncbi:glucosamine-6-phosphate deaminase [Neorhizobium galegae]|uniref:glucosamine-6-phosphate deaminase n=1 Tax=Neorhizobium galegae TaxID=399 RepID=UPI0013538EB1|nr:glucosamine-6-phosphate deaminase [Neorhizobium galegae]KAB1115056.1 glucosamine-6-phosphate deaminase [Neorhizobium galegae]MCQ1774395.1 glucosamine-6-phosphate deaminase [Neorhizobium galegae]MCQ1798947.1 glucosamine-6-phosphate deaminase [Neorhizobium galegae]
MNFSLQKTALNDAHRPTIFPTADDAADAVADHLLATVKRDPKSVLGLATGQTPRRVYKRLVDAFLEGEVSFRDVETFNLDEYCGLAASHTDSFAAFMQRELFGLADFDPDSLNLIDGAAADLTAEAARYAALLRDSGGIDVQLLGLGANGHIGFNEPGSAHDSHVRIVDLSDETLSANQPSLTELRSVPSQAITLGIADILNAREIIMLATGPAKAAAVRRSLREKPSTDCPASLLRSHTNIHWYLDSAAAAELG